MSFWSRFWCLLCPFWPPFWSLLAPKSSQVRSRTRLERLSSSKSLFSKKNERRVGHSTILTPRRHPRRAKIGPRRLQDLPKTILKSVFSLLKIAFDFDSFWDRFWLHLGSQLLPLWHPFRIKIDQKIDPKSDCSKSRPKIAPRPPKTAPRCPRTPQEPPRCPPGPPWTAQKAFPEHRAQDTFSENSKTK